MVNAKTLKRSVLAILHMRRPYSDAICKLRFFKRSCLPLAKVWEYLLNASGTCSARKFRGSDRSYGCFRGKLPASCRMRASLLRRSAPIAAARPMVSASWCTSATCCLVRIATWRRSNSPRYFASCSRNWLSSCSFAAWTTLPMNLTSSLLMLLGGPPFLTIPRLFVGQRMRSSLSRPSCFSTSCKIFSVTRFNHSSRTSRMASSVMSAATLPGVKDAALLLSIFSSSALNCSSLANLMKCLATSPSASMVIVCLFEKKVSVRSFISGQSTVRIKLSRSILS
mmetsp:Transcript_12438/g.35858  ORF Transcript_12438/g.35858 Transcript_12438/m.35858 type:complete len:282 (-) Transcript_12438:4819-5664(-)